MVALLHPQSQQQPQQQTQQQTQQQPRPQHRRPRAERHLVSVPVFVAQPDTPTVALGSVADWINELDRRVLSVIGAMVAAFLLLSVVQGGPPADAGVTTDAGTVAVAPVEAQLGEYTLVAQPGDTYWAIASSLVSGTDVRPIVEQLVARNGSADLQAGQQVIIPGDLG